MYEFRYQRPGSLAEALEVLAADSDAKVVAGGMTLIPSMKHRLSAPSQLLDIAALPELQGITVDDDRLVVGAATFGIGWGLGGFCPGPALTSLPMAASGTLLFVPAMLVGMIAAKYLAAPAPKTQAS